MTDTLAAWRQTLVTCIHFLHARGYAPATSSNYSFRLPEEEAIHISASGIDKGEFRAEDLMRIDRAGRPVDDPRKPSAETRLHTLIYDRQPGVHCVLHTHTVYNTVLSALYATEGRIRLAGFEVLKGLAGVRTHDTYVDLPIFPNSQDMPALAAAIGDYWDEHPGMRGFLLAGHGLYTWGATIAEARRQVEVFEFLLECFYKIRTFEKAGGK